jgi:hypothetical protein
VPEHVKKAAREMAQRAFKQRLREIQMSEYDAQLYGQFSNAVSRQVIVIKRWALIFSQLHVQEYQVLCDTHIRCITFL